MINSPFILSIKATAAILPGQPVSVLGAVSANALPIAGVYVGNEAAAIGDYMPCVVIGSTPVLGGAVVAAGARLEVSGGKFITLAAGVDVGQALEAGSLDTMFQALIK
jgi:hypothetical protein